MTNHLDARSITSSVPFLDERGLRIAGQDGLDVGQYLARHLWIGIRLFRQIIEHANMGS